MALKVKCVILIAIVNSACSLNIFGIFPHAGRSHFFVFSKYLEELAKRGHNVTVVSHFSEKQPIDNYRTISLAGTTNIIDDEMPAEKNMINKLAMAVMLQQLSISDCEIMLANQQVRDSIENDRFDLVVIEQFNSDCGLGIAYKLGAPVIGITSHSLLPFHYARFGIPDHPAYVSYLFLEGGTKPSLYQRVERTLYDFFLKTLYKYGSQLFNQRTLAKYYDGIPTLEELAKEIKLLLAYYNFVLTGSRLHPPNVIEVGGLHVGKAKPLTGKLKEFYDKTDNGVIYISFGSMVKGNRLDKQIVETIVKVINKLPLRFVWKCEDNTFGFDKNKVYMASWLPQADILAHPKTKALFSHGGMLGTTEGIHYGVPIVVMSIFGDQPSNGAAIEESGLGVHVEIQELTEEKLLNAFKTVLQPSFHERVKELSSAWHDRPMSPMDTAIYWTEFVARHPNITYKHPATDTPLYQHWMLDVYLVLFAAIGSIVLVIKYTCFYCCRKRDKFSKKVKKN